jgi:hypothetical protein
MLGQVLGGGTAQGSTGGSDLLGSLMGVTKEMSRRFRCQLGNIQEQ